MDHTTNHPYRTSIMTILGHMNMMARLRHLHMSDTSHMNLADRMTFIASRMKCRPTSGSRR